MRRKALIILTVFVALLIVAGFSYTRLPGKVVNAVNFARCKMISGVTKNENRSNNPKSSDTFHLRCVKPDTALDEIISKKGIKKTEEFNIYIDVSKRTLYFRHKEETLKEYIIACGSRTPLGFKEKEGDYKTPCGEFFICEKTEYNPTKNYIGSRWMMLSYPNSEAADRGLKSNMISEEINKKIKKAISNKKTPPQDTKLGSYIGIHGGAKENFPKDWTAGCIGMYDRDVEEIYRYLKVGSKVVIR